MTWKASLTLLVGVRQLNQYSITHTIVIRKNHKIRKILYRLDLAKRMTKWLVKLSEFDIIFESRKALKGKALTNFVVEMTPASPEQGPSGPFLSMDPPTPKETGYESYLKMIRGRSFKFMSPSWSQPPITKHNTKPVALQDYNWHMNSAYKRLHWTHFQNPSSPNLSEKTKQMTKITKITHVSEGYYAKILKGETQTHFSRTKHKSRHSVEIGYNVSSSWQPWSRHPTMSVVWWHKYWNTSSTLKHLFFQETLFKKVCVKCCLKVG